MFSPEWSGQIHISQEHHQRINSTIIARPGTGGGWAVQCYVVARPNKSALSTAAAATDTTTDAAVECAIIMQ